MMDVLRSGIPAMATEGFGAGEIREISGSAAAGYGASLNRKMKKARSAVALSPDNRILLLGDLSRSTLKRLLRTGSRAGSFEWSAQGLEKNAGRDGGATGERRLRFADGLNVEILHRPSDGSG
jgi:hypothetical protein